MTDTQAAVAAALMQAAEVVYQFFDALSFDDEWSLEDLQAAILALITTDAMAALEAVKAEALLEVEKQILQAAGDEYTLEHSSEGPAERMGLNSAVRGMMVRLGLYDKMEAAIDAALEAKP